MFNSDQLFNSLSLIRAFGHYILVTSFFQMMSGINNDVILGRSRGSSVIINLTIIFRQSSTENRFSRAHVHQILHALCQAAHQRNVKATLLLFETIENRCKLNEIKLHSPHIFSGASNSSKIGCDKNISRDLRHRFRMSTSLSWTFFPGRAPRTVNKSK